MINSLYIMKHKHLSPQSIYYFQIYIDGDMLIRVVDNIERVNFNNLPRCHKNIPSMI